MTEHEKEPGGEPIALEITDVLDLHAFAPRDVGTLVADYLELARAEGFEQVRIIHGRGRGTQRRLVRAQLERHPEVEAFGDAPPEAGGWGATWARFRAPASGRSSS